MKRKYLVVVAVSIVSLLGSNVYYISKNLEYKNTIAELKTTVHNATKESSEYLLQVNDLNLVLKDKDTTIQNLETKVTDLEKQEAEKVKVENYKKRNRKHKIKKYHLKSSVLTKNQLKRADYIAKYVADSYKKYGVLPSVAVGQAMQETQLGTDNNCSAINSYGWWGVKSKIHSGYARYSSLDEGIQGYLNCLNNGRYDKALFNKSPVDSMYAVQKGGYCDNSYAENVINCIQQFNFTEYDKYYLKE